MTAWDDLGRRLGRVTGPARLSTDIDGLRELVAIASGLKRALTLRFGRMAAGRLARLLDPAALEPEP